MEGWYSNGTQVVFACGGGIYTSAVEAALKSNGYVVGVDVDQNYIGVNGVADGSFAYNPFITSAMKGLTEAVNTALSDIEAGDWSDIAASNGNFGLEDGDYIGLPTDADSWNFETFTTDEYEALKSKMAQGALGNVMDKVTEVKGVKLLAAALEGVDMNGLRDLGDQLKEKLGEGVVVLASANDGKVCLMATATDGAMKQGAHAGNLVKGIAQIVGGGGGGRPNMAQAGGKNPDKIPEAIAAVAGILEDQIK